MAKAYEAAIAGLPPLWAEGRLCESLVFKAGGRISLPKLRRIFRCVFEYRGADVRFRRGGDIGCDISVTPPSYRRSAVLRSAAHVAPLRPVLSRCPVSRPAEKAGRAQTAPGSAAARYTAAASSGQPPRPGPRLGPRRKPFVQTLLIDYNLLIYRRVLLGV